MTGESKSWVASHVKSTVLTVLAVVAAVGGMLLFFHMRGNQEETVREEKVYTVRVIEAESTGNEVAVEYTGLVQPSQVMQCVPDTIGNIAELYVAEGDLVTRGQPLARLDASNAQLQADNMQSVLQAAQNSLNSAISARDRARADYEEASAGAPQAEIDAARAERNAARTERDQKQQEVSRIDGLLAPQQKKTDEAKAAYEQALTARNEAEARRAEAEAAHKAALDALNALEKTPESTAEPAESAPEMPELPDLFEIQPMSAPAASSEELEAARARVEETRQALEQAESDLQKAVDAEADALAAMTKEQAELTGQQASLGKVAADGALEAAKVQLEAKEAALDLLQSKGDGMAKVQLERLEAANTAVTQAQAMYDAAKRTADNASENAKDTILRAPANGHVVKVVGTEGGLATPIAPVVVVASDETSIEFGASQSDVRSLQVGMDAAVTLDDKIYYGHVTNIALLPDEATRTYPVSVSVDQGGDELFLGSMAKVQLSMGQRTGIWLPLSVILNDGQDYVYIVRDGHALRRDVEITEISNDKVLVMGLDAGCQVISEGVKTVRSGSAVRVMDQSEGEDA